MQTRTHRQFEFNTAATAFLACMVLGLFGMVARDLATKPAAQHHASGAGATGQPLVRVSVLKPATVHSISSAVKLANLFERIGYRLERVREQGVAPRLFMTKLPGDLKQVQGPAERKRLFIRMALPLVLHVNDLIRLDRARLKRLRDQRADGQALAAEDRAWLDETAARYGLDKPDLDALLRRVDVIPPSLALAQSAEESGWGTSRFAYEGNALFGQRIWRGNRGIVPKARPAGEKYRVRAFVHLIDGVKSYAHNLNSHPAYAAFRKKRAEQRENGTAPRGYALAGTLLNYSERGAAYVETIRTIMRVNRLRVLDHVRLTDSIDLPAWAPDA